MNGLNERVVNICSQIRRYAARGPGRIAGAFTIHLEIDALCELQEYRAAWRRLRLQEEIVFGERLDLRRRKWSIADGPAIENQYAPLLFFLGRYHQGCAL